jgi:hypothetical protein
MVYKKSISSVRTMFEIVQIITKEFLNDQEKAISVYGTQNIKNAAPNREFTSVKLNMTVIFFLICSRSKVHLIK